MAEIPATPMAAGDRLRSIDILRGLVIVLMVLDHVRDYLHSGAWQFNPLDPSTSDAAVYITRWVTHLCAPTFVFLAGVSAHLQAMKGKSPAVLSRFLLLRGLWLVALELVVVGFGFAFAIPFIAFLQVIWAIGISMVVLAALVWLPRTAVLAIGVVIVLGHNLLDPITPQQLGEWGTLWTLLHAPGVVLSDGQPAMLVAYPVIAWFGIMALGYGMGAVFLSPNRDRLLLLAGSAMIALFLVLRLVNGYGNPQPWTSGADTAATVMNFFNVQKYPPSLMYVCATLGPVLLLTPLLERWRGRIADFLRVFGSVPLMAYVLHIYLAHLLAIALNAVLGQPIAPFFDYIRNFVFDPPVFKGTGVPLPWVYVAWLALLVVLYPSCRWWANVRATRRKWWMSYL